MINLKELVHEGIISDETAKAIRHYYDVKKSSSKSRILIAFGILGSLLVGLGMLLIIAHNWDNLSKGIKTVIAFLPLLVGQIACAYVLQRKSGSIAWREGAAIFLFLSIGVALSVISQIFNISGSLDSFLLTWLILAFPIVYVMTSSMSSLLVIGGATWFMLEAGYDSSRSITPHYYWLFLVGILPYYRSLVINYRASNFTIFHHWLLPISLLFAIGVFGDNNGEFMFLAYITLLGCFIMIGREKFISTDFWITNGYYIIGVIGSLGLLLACSFNWFWQEENFTSLNFVSREFILAIVLFVVGLCLIYRRQARKEFYYFQILFVGFWVAFFIGLFSPIAGQIIVNVLLFMVAVLTIREGAISEHLGKLNLGLLVISALIGARFFDINMSFVLRGIIFVALGIGFFVANYLIIKNRNIDE